MLRDAMGKPAGFIIALRDVSERKLMEQRLRDSEEMARGMLESAAAGIYLVQNGSFEYVSPLFASISGYSSDELMGTQALGYVHPDDRDMVREKAIESLRGQSTLPYEFRFVQKDGTIVWMLEKVASIQYKGKRATIASIMDITERKRAEQALRESEEKLRSFMDSATDYFTIWDSKLTLIDLNEAALRYPIVDFPGKLRKESLVGKNILKLEPTIRETDRYDRYMEVIRTGKPFFAEDIIPHTKLGDVHMAISAFRVGEGLGIITTDVTERRRSEEELRRSKVDLEKRTNQLLALQKVTASIQSTLSLSDVLQQVAEGVVDMGYDQSMVIVVDEKADVYRARAYFSKDRPKYREGVESIVEQALVDIHFPRKRGYSMGVDESLDGKVVITPNFSALAVPPLTKQQANAVQKFLGANTIVSMPLFAMERHVGGILAFTARDDITETDVEPLRLLADQAGVAIVNANIYEGAAEMAQRLAVTGTLSRILGSSLDIREVYQAFIDEIHNVIDFERASIALVDGDQLQFLAVSPDVGPGGDTVMPAAGSPTEWVIRHKQTNIEHDLTAERQFSIDDVYVEEGMRSAIRVPLISKGEAFGSFNLVSRSRNAYGEREQGILEQVAGSIAAAIENSRLFTRVRQHEAELVKAYDELKKAQEYMVQAERLRALGELAGGVAHDFNNILAVILGRAQLALEDVKDAKLKKDLKIIEQTALDAATTVRRLQDFARVRVDRGFETVDLNELVEDALQMVESRRMELKETRGVIIGVNTDLGEVPSVQGQAAELREALLNILFNAIDAMPKGGSLTVNSKKDKAGVVLSISDTGEGIPDDVRSKIFDPFFTTRPQKGSGLGLSVTYGIITRHGGKIHCASEVGKGTTFYIWLPVTAGVKAEKPPQKKLVGVKSAEVLLVDDDPDVSEVMQRMLQQMGHRVTAVNSGEEAVNIFESGHYDLVVTDLGMPDMSGREVAAAVKDIKPGTPVLLITGWGVQLDQSELPEIDGIVAKPFSKEVLREQLAKLLPGDGGLSEGKSRKKKGPR
jgi:PAS domain S-box-containing protein